MRVVVLALVFLVQCSALAQRALPQQDPRQVEQEAIMMSREVLETLRRGTLNYDDLVGVRDELRDVISIIRNGAKPSLTLICTKSGNGRYYPTNPENGDIIGSSDWGAGHDFLKDCRNSLPKRGDRIACFKNGNGRYYPSNPKTGDIIGSSDWGAGFDFLKDCLLAIAN